MGAGLVFVGTGVAFGLAASSARSDAEDLCPKTPAGARYCPASAQDAIDRDSRNSLIADITIGVGVIAIGVGAYLTFIKKGDVISSESQASIAPLPEGGAQVTWFSRF